MGPMTPQAYAWPSLIYTRITKAFSLPEMTRRSVRKSLELRGLRYHLRLTFRKGNDSVEIVGSGRWSTQIGLIFFGLHCDINVNA